MLAAALLAGALGIVALALWRSGGIGGRVAAWIEGSTRPRMIFALAIGISVNCALPALIALASIGRLDAFAVLPFELRGAASRLGLPGSVDAAALGLYAISLAVGIAGGVAILLVRRWLGKRPLGLAYRSAFAARGVREWPAAALLAVSAGVAEEAFFRLLLPLLVAMVTGSGLAGLAVGLAAFTALHRHQGRAGMIAVGLVGALFTYVYLATGLLWIAMLLHVLLDLNALIVRPAISS